MNFITIGLLILIVILTYICGKYVSIGKKMFKYLKNKNLFTDFDKYIEEDAEGFFLDYYEFFRD